MTLILKNSFFGLSGILLLGILFSHMPAAALAQTSDLSQTISVSPTLFEMKAAPGQTWTSEIRVVNVNNYDMVVYPQVVNFEPLDESGRVDLIFDMDASLPDATLAEWITISMQPVTILEQQTITIPFSITAPMGAPPGGHYAAILIGTRPPASDGGTSKVQTAQFVTSLLFVRIDGDIIEKGNIREFRSSKNIVPNSEATFELRFENTGNVYLQPQGDIVIYNMWGTKRGIIPINHQTNYGRVVQSSIREFVFSWKGEPTFLDIGRYKAVATLGYGEESKQFSNKTTYFWIIPYQQIFIALSIIISIVLFLGWIVRMYIRRMFMLAGIDPATARSRMQHKPQILDLESTHFDDSNVKPAAHLFAPLRQGVLDVRNQILHRQQHVDKKQSIVEVLFTYRMFFVSLVGLGLIFAAILWFVTSVSNSSREYEVTIENTGAPITLSSEEIYYQTLKSSIAPQDAVAYIEQPFSIDVVNRSGTLGVAAQLRIDLEQKGYVVANVKTEIGASTNRTVIVFHPDMQSHALALSQALSGALLSGSESHPLEKITIFAGTDTR